MREGLICGDNSMHKGKEAIGTQVSEESPVVQGA